MRRPTISSYIIGRKSKDLKAYRLFVAINQGR